MLRVVTVFSALASASAAIELTPDTWDKEVAGKHAFVKFLAPWCGHCKKMKPDWDALANEYKDSQSVLIADVDCTAAGEPLCKKHGVSGYPTIKTFAPNSEDGDAYEGGRSLDDLRKHAQSLGPSCDLEHKDLCSAEDLAKLEKFAAMSAERRQAKLTKLKNAITKKEHEHEKLQKSLSARYEASNKHLESLREEYKVPIKLMTAASPKA